MAQPDRRFDVAVVGAGLLGLATAREVLQRDPAARVVVIEKEPAPARHQSGHNSGVIHSGLYYAPGSAKARLCVRGRRLMVAYLEEHAIPFEMCGKLVVASSSGEATALEALRERGVANGLSGLRLVDEREMREIEPHVRGVRALWLPEAGIVDYARVATVLAEEIRGRGAAIELGTRVVSVDAGEREVRLGTDRGTFVAGSAIACAGLGSDRLAALAGATGGPRIVPFRGDYWVLRPERRALVRGLVYPVPDPRFPFLGVHFTRRIDGAVWLGPNAVLAFAREGYRRRDLNVRDLAETLGDRGFRLLAARYWRMGALEMARDLWKPLFLAELRRYMPELTSRDLLPGPSGVRAQALDRDGRLLDDFAFDVAGRLLNVRNAPSPAATSSLALAREFVDRLATITSG